MLKRNKVNSQAYFMWAFIYVIVFLHITWTMLKGTQWIYEVIICEHLSTLAAEVIELYNLRYIFLPLYRHSGSWQDNSPVKQGVLLGMTSKITG